MLKQIRHTLTNHLWETYRHISPQIKQIETKLNEKGIVKLTLDHFAVIDLPGPHTGIHQLSQIFSAIGYLVQGRDYLKDKQNDFLWLTECDSKELKAHDVLPQVVVADFRLEEMPIEIRKIIEKYASQAKISPLHEIQQLAGRAFLDDANASKRLCDIITNYFAGRDWPLPTTKEFYTVKEFNELLAWVLVFGRRPNHFTLSVHLLDRFSDLADFHRFIENEVGLQLNQDGGVIKGNKDTGIAQGSTLGTPQTKQLADGWIELPGEFVEFVWRYPRDGVAAHEVVFWKDYFTGFIANHADRVIESLYVNH